ncbi:MAG TPA: PhoPQ-activated protein PqaA family protein [Fimbriimonadaceae bacterium]|nr:PhoPQ-activated protein PqaA family protein [Fimbriimonadaceae bacterium]
MLTGLIALIAADAPMPPELDAYLRRPDSSFTWKVGEKSEGLTTLQMTSQTWQGIRWEHDIVLTEPAAPVAKGTAVLVITGGKPNRDDLNTIRTIVGQAGLPAAVLFQIPNQPLWDRVEDDLIAHTFEKYLETGDASWPLLFPMTKSAIRAMDAVQAYTKGSSNPITKFIVTGASKRGWTTWMVGASGDRRVVGIAPLVIDNLNVGAQMKHQLASWGKYSEQIDDYTRRGLQQKMETPAGRKLAAMVDPYSYRSRIKAKTLIVNGGNDPYWTIDALGLYLKDLKQPTWTMVVPNAGHDLGDRLWLLRTLTAFCQSVAGRFPMPRFKADVGAAETRFSSVSAGARRFRIWAIESKTLDFRPEKWKVLVEMTIEGGSGGSPILRYGPSSTNRALMAEVEFKVRDRTFSLTTPVRVFKRR